MARQFWSRPKIFVSYLFCFSLLNFACTSGSEDQTPEESVTQSPSETPTNEFDQAYQEAAQADENSAADSANPNEPSVSSSDSTPVSDTNSLAGESTETPATADVPSQPSDTMADTAAPSSSLSPEEEVGAAPDYTLDQSAGNAVPAPSSDAGLASEMTDTPSSMADAMPSEPMAPVMDESAAPKVEKAKKHRKNKSFAKKSKKRRASPANDMAEVSSGSAAQAGDGVHGQYIVQAGDSLSKIASRIYGSKKEWRSLAKLNAMKNPKRLYPGDVIVYKMSERTAKFDAVYKDLEMHEVEVKKGDTLGRIAARTLGSADAWRTLWKMNRDAISNPNKIEVGTKLKYYNPKKLSQALREAGLISAHH